MNNENTSPQQTTGHTFFLEGQRETLERQILIRAIKFNLLKETGWNPFWARAHTRIECKSVGFVRTSKCTVISERKKRAVIEIRKQRSESVVRMSAEHVHKVFQWAESNTSSQIGTGKQRTPRRRFSQHIDCRARLHSNNEPSDPVNLSNNKSTEQIHRDKIVFTGATVIRESICGAYPSS